MRAFLIVVLSLMIPQLVLAGDAKVVVDGSVTVVDAGAEAGPALPPANPKDLKEALETGKNAVAAAKSGNWWLFSALVVTLVLFLLKLLGTKVGSWWSKLGRWRYVIPPVLSLAAALLATFQGGVSIDAAVTVFTASWATTGMEELWNHGILGKNKARDGS